MAFKILANLLVKQFTSQQKQIIKERVTLARLDPASWSEVHDEVIQSFVSDSQRMLIVYVDELNGLTCEHIVPYVQVSEIAYFIKKYESQLITVENFFKTVQFGTVSGGHIQSLLRLMSAIYAPIFFENKTWPDSIKNDFSAQLHRFLASLTDTRWKLDGKTVLYIPTEGLSMDSEKAAKNKELVQRLESKCSCVVLTRIRNGCIGKLCVIFICILHNKIWELCINMDFGLFCIN